MRALLPLLALVVAGAGWASMGASQLVLSGALKTSSARNVTTDEGCGYRPGVRLSGRGIRRYRMLIFESAAMQLGRGPAVARVEFSLPNFHGVGSYDATRPRMDYGRTPVQVVAGRNATTGVGSRWFLAGAGSVRVTSARKVAVAGSVDVVLGDRGSVVRLRGTWRCAIAR